MSTKNKFGIIEKLYFLQDFLSHLVSNFNPAILHNIAKYIAIKKVHYLSGIEDIKGDYLEFGVYTGSSFCHSIRCSIAMAKISKNATFTKFYGFDSFAGFGELKTDDAHPFYVDHNFITSIDLVHSRIKKIVSSDELYKLVPGFFEDTLTTKPATYGVTLARIVFIDSDTYTSAKLAFNFISKITVPGTYFILDDFFSYKGNSERGVAKAFMEFTKDNNLSVRNVFNYGMGGSVFIVSSVNQI